MTKSKTRKTAEQNKNRQIVRESANSASVIKLTPDNFLLLLCVNEDDVETVLQ